MNSEPADVQTKWRIGPFELDLSSRELSRNGTRVRLQEQPFEVLCALAERAGQVVTRDELRGRLWPNGTFVDFEHSLNAAIRRLRGALGDDALEPRFIETVPRRGYRLISEVAEGRREAASACVDAGPPRMAVLPFADLSEANGHSSFGDGLTDEALAQIATLCRNRLSLVARRSSASFHGSSHRASQIGESLKVAYLLEGSVRRDGDRIRVIARLVDAPRETLIWSEGFDRRSVEVLDVQTEIATRIAHSVSDVIGRVPAATAKEPALPIRSVLSDGSDRDAYRAFVKGEYYWQKPGDSGLDQALTFYAEGVKLAPAFAAAHAGMARGMVSRAVCYREPGREALARARESARQALALDARHAEAHLTLADVSRMLDFDWAGAQESYRTAIALNPVYEGSHRCYAYLLSALGRHDEARQVADQAQQLDPFCMQVGTGAAWVRFAARDYEGAIDQCVYTLEFAPEYVPARRLLGTAYLLAGRESECVETFDAAVAERSDQPVLLASAAHAYAVLGERDRALELAAILATPDRDWYVPSYHLGLVWLALGDTDKAFALFRAGYEERDPAFSTFPTDPRFDEVRSDPRYSTLLGLARVTEFPRAGSTVSSLP